MEESTKYSVEVLKAFIAENGRWPSADLRKEHSSKFERGLYVWANAQIKKGNQEVINLKKATPTKRSLSRWGMTLEEKVKLFVKENRRRPRPGDEIYSAVKDAAKRNPVIKALIEVFDTPIPEPTKIEAPVFAVPADFVLPWIKNYCRYDLVAQYILNREDFWNEAEEALKMKESYVEKEVHSMVKRLLEGASQDSRWYDRECNRLDLIDYMVGKKEEKEKD